MTRTAPTIRAALLLEVVIALSVLTTAMAFLSAQLAVSVDMLSFSEEQSKAAYLADQALALLEYDPNLTPRLFDEETLEEPFGDAYPRYFWRAKLEPIEEDRTDLYVVTLDILYQRDAENPDAIDGADTIRQLALLRTPAATIDLVSDAGVPDEVIDQLAQNIPLPNFDPRALDLQQIVALDPTILEQLIPYLMQALAQVGGNLSNIQQALQNADIGDMLDGVGGGDVDQIRGMVDDAMNGGGAGGGRGPGGNRGMGGGPGRGGPGAGGPQGPPGRNGTGQANPPSGAGANGNNPFPPGGGSGPDGRYTIEDLMRIRDEMRRQQEGG